MPTWRCPHCGTPQAETARCWVCRRSSTACGTCRHFRRSVAAQLGYCGLDRRRAPLAGDEIRGCWEATTAATLVTMPGPPGAAAAAVVPMAGSERAGRLDFVEVGTTRPIEPGPIEAPPISQPPPAAAEPGWSLWGDAEA